MENHDYVDLVVVEEHNTKSRYIAQCHAWQATVGGLVEFEADDCMNIGEIIDAATVRIGSDQYKFISKMGDIIPCVRVWSPVGDSNVSRFR